MSNKSKTTESRPDQTIQTKPDVASDVETLPALPGLGLLDGPLEGAETPAIQTRAGQLADSRLPDGQRTALAAQIGNSQGNGHLQRVLALRKPTNGHSSSGTLAKKKARSAPAGKAQAKLTVNPPDDIYEQEADRVADSVVAMAQPADAAPPPESNADAPPVDEIRAAEAQEELATQPPALQQIEVAPGVTVEAGQLETEPLAGSGGLETLADTLGGDELLPPALSSEAAGPELAVALPGLDADAMVGVGEEQLAAQVEQADSALDGVDDETLLPDDAETEALAEADRADDAFIDDDKPLFDLPFAEEAEAGLAQLNSSPPPVVGPRPIAPEQVAAELSAEANPFTAIEAESGAAPSPPLLTEGPAVSNGDSSEPAEIQRRAAGADVPVVSSHTEAKIDRMRGGGTPLTGADRAFFEPRFGQDFGDVRIHTGPEAAETAAALGARAFTVGSDIVFGAGEFDPHTSEGKHLLAHELTHTVQQTGGQQLATKAKPKRVQRFSFSDIGKAFSSVGKAIVSPFKKAGEWALKQLANGLKPVAERAAKAAAAGATGQLGKESGQKQQEGRQQYANQQARKQQRQQQTRQKALRTQQTIERKKQQRQRRIQAQIDKKNARLTQWGRQKTKQTHKRVADKGEKEWQRVTDWGRGTMVNLGTEANKMATQQQPATQQKAQALKQKVEDGLSWLAEGPQKARDWLNGFSNKIREQAAQILNRVQETLNRAISAVGDKAKATVDGIANLANTIHEKVIGPLNKKIGQALTAIRQRVNAVLKQIDKNIQQGIKRLTGMITQMVRRFSAQLKRAIAAFASRVKQAINRLTNLINNAVSRVKGILGKVLSILAGFISRLINAVLKPVINLITRVLTAIISQIANMLTPLINLLGRALQAIAKSLMQALRSAFNAFMKALQAAHKQFAQMLKTLLTTVANQIAGLVKRLIDKFQKALQTFLNETLAKAFKAIVDNVMKLVNAFLDKILAIVQGVLEFINAVWQVAQLLMQLLKTGPETIFKIAKAPGEFIEALWEAARQGFRQFVANAEKHLKDEVLEWLFPKAAEQGLELPPVDFKNPQSILMFLLSTMGYGEAQLRERLKAKVSERQDSERDPGDQAGGTDQPEAAAPIEAAATQAGMPQPNVEEALQSVEQITTEEILAQAEEIDPQPIFESLLKKAVDYVAKEIMETAIARVLVSAGTAGAGAIFEVLKAVLEAVKTFIARINEVKRILQALIDSVKSLADRIIAEAANRVEFAIKDSISVVLTWLENYLDVDISAGVQRIIGEIQSTVEPPLETALNFVADGIAAAHGLYDRYNGYKQSAQEYADMAADYQEMAADLPDAVGDMVGSGGQNGANGYQQLAVRVSQLTELADSGDIPADMIPALAGKQIEPDEAAGLLQEVGVARFREMLANDEFEPVR